MVWTISDSAAGRFVRRELSSEWVRQSGLSFRSRQCSRMDGEGELLGGLLAVVVADLHGEGEGSRRGGRAGELVAGIARPRTAVLQGQAGREVAGGDRPGVGIAAAAEEEVLPVGLPGAVLLR
jgi:hypothetical protein